MIEELRAAARLEDGRVKFLCDNHYMLVNDNARVGIAKKKVKILLMPDKGDVRNLIDAVRNNVANFLFVGLHYMLFIYHCHRLAF